MSLKKRFVLLSCAVGVLLVASVTLGQMVSKMAHLVSEAENRRYLSYLIANELRKSSSDLTSLCRTYAATEDKKYSDAYWHIVNWRAGKAARPASLNPELHPGETIEQTKIMEELGFSKKELGLLEKARVNSEGLIATEDQAMKVIASGKFVEGPWKMKEDERPRDFAIRVVFDENYHAAVENIMKPVNEFFAELDARTGAEVAEAQRMHRTLSRLATALQLIVAVMVGMMILYLVRAVFSPLSRLTTLMSEVAKGEGDLTKRLDLSSKDEIGELAAYFNQFIESLQSIMRQISGNVGTVASSATELSAVSAQTAHNVQNMSSGAETVASAAGESSVNLTSVAASMEQASMNLSSVASATEEMSATISEIASSSERARAVSHEASEQAASVSGLMKQLDLAAHEIGKVTETITNISSQTNLLALNATIEAARAGAAGKGFAVVANEIKDLAHQTTEATEDIKQRIGGVQRSATDAISFIEKIATVISDVGQIVSTIAAAIEEQAMATREVAGNIAQATAGVRDANEHVARTASMSKSIAEDVAGISMAATEISGGGEQVQASAAELSRMAEQLSGLVGRFRV